MHPVALRRRGRACIQNKRGREGERRVDRGWMAVAIMVKRGREGRREGDACEIGLDQRDFLNQRRERQRDRRATGDWRLAAEGFYNSFRDQLIWTKTLKGSLSH